MGDIGIAREGNCSLVKLHERFGARDVPELQTALKAEIAAGATEIAFDFSTVISLDSTAIGLMIATNNSLAASGGAVRLDNVPQAVMKLLSAMRLTERLHARAAGKGGSDGK